jgi:hypothetical protein
MQDLTLTGKPDKAVPEKMQLLAGLDKPQTSQQATR